MKKLLSIGLALALILLVIGVFKAHNDKTENLVSMVDTIRNNRGTIVPIESVDNQLQE